MKKNQVSKKLQEAAALQNLLEIRYHLLLITWMNKK